MCTRIDLEELVGLVNSEFYELTKIEDWMPCVLEQNGLYDVILFCGRPIFNSDVDTVKKADEILSQVRSTSLSVSQLTEITEE